MTTVPEIPPWTGSLNLDCPSAWVPTSRLSAAHARAVRPFLVAGTYTLDHDDGARDPTLAGVAQPGFQIRLGDDLRPAVSVPVFLGLINASAGRDDHHTMLEI